MSTSPDSSRRDLYLVIGINRSGTSALAKALAACGVALDFEHPDFPHGAWKKDASREDGGYEGYEVMAVLELVRGIAGRLYGDEARPPLTDELVFNATETLAVRGVLELIPRFPFAIKDPLLTFQFPQWKQAARECRPPIGARPIVSLRHPVASAHALLRRRFCRTLRGGLDLWLRYYSEVQFLLGSGEEPLIVLYDGQRERFVAQIEALCGALSLPFDGDRVRAEFVPARIDEPDDAELQQHPLAKTIAELYDALARRRLG